MKIIIIIIPLDHNNLPKMNVLKAYLPDYLIDEIYMHLHQIHVNELNHEYREEFKPLSTGGCCTLHKMTDIMFYFNTSYGRIDPGGDRQPTIYNWKTFHWSPIKGPINYRYTSGKNHPNAYR